MTDSHSGHHLPPAAISLRAGGDQGSSVHVARQPILDTAGQVYGYELLYRSGISNQAIMEDGTHASASVIDTSFFLHGINSLTHGRKAFVNFTREALLRGFGELLPPSLAVIELLEDIEIDDDIVGACRALKSKGFLLALDDVITAERGQELTGLADIVKVDLLGSSPVEWQRIAGAYRGTRVRLLAEKVESIEIFEQTCKLGYSLFQGYYFSKPVMVSTRALPVSQMAQLRILQEINQPEVNLEEVTRIVESDPSLSYRLLTLVSSAALGLRHQVTSLHRAALILGVEGLRKWTSVVVLKLAADSKPSELLTSSLIRAHLCERLAGEIGFAARGSELFLMGLFSQIDALLDRPIEVCLENLSLEPDVHDALRGESGTLRELLHLVQAYERAEWDAVVQSCLALRIEPETLSEAYAAAIEQVDAILG